jgi:hypothetical protein
MCFEKSNNIPNEFKISKGVYRQEIRDNWSKLQTLFSPYWLWEPNFVAILEDSHSVYIFFTEYSIEEYKYKWGWNASGQLLANHLNKITFDRSNSLIRYSRVARVCKSDKGFPNIDEPRLTEVWSTFRKIRMKCNCNQNFLNVYLFRNENFNPNKRLVCLIYLVFLEILRQKRDTVI